MKYLKLYKNQAEAINQNIETPVVISMTGVTKQLFVNHDEFETILLTDDVITENDTEKDFITYEQGEDESYLHYQLNQINDTEDGAEITENVPYKDVITEINGTEDGAELPA